MLPVTLSNDSAISIDNEPSDLWRLADIVLFLLKRKKMNFTFFPILVKWQSNVETDVHDTSLLIKYEIAQNILWFVLQP